MRLCYLTRGFACISYLALGSAPAQLKCMWREDEGFLTFEWILLITLLLIGILAALSAVRDAIAGELIGVGGAIVSVDSSYSICPPIQGGAGITTPCSIVKLLLWRWRGLALLATSAVLWRASHKRHHAGAGDLLLVVAWHRWPALGPSGANLELARVLALNLEVTRCQPQ